MDQSQPKFPEVSDICLVPSWISNYADESMRNDLVAAYTAGRADHIAQVASRPRKLVEVNAQELERVRVGRLEIVPVVDKPLADGEFHVGQDFEFRADGQSLDVGGAIARASITFALDEPVKVLFEVVPMGGA
jgi:hypothetical protein